MKNILKGLMVFAVSFAFLHAKDLPKASIDSMSANGANVHSFTAYSGDVSNIIEFDKSLILVDFQPTKSATKELESYVKSLKKPLKAIVVPTHGIGKNLFKNVPVYETAQMDKFNRGKGIETFINIFSKFFKNDMTKTAVGADKILKNGKNVIDGKDVVVSTDENGFPPTSDLVFAKESIYFTHLIADNSHLLVGAKEAINPLIKKFENIKQKGYKAIISSHLKITGQNGVDFSLKYLQTVQNTLKTAKTKEAFIEAMKKAYPKAKNEKFLMMSAGKLYKTISNKH